MIIAIIGSRNLTADLDKFIPRNVTEIVSGGAKGIDLLAHRFALLNNIKLTEFLPEYNKYKRNAPLIRNKLIVEYADKIFAFWDGKSKGTAYTINYAKSISKEVEIIYCENIVQEPC